MKNRTTPLRKRDILVIKIVDWSDDPKDCTPAIDVEVYVNGEFDIEKSKVFSIDGVNVKKPLAILQAKKFAEETIKKELKTNSPKEDVIYQNRWCKIVAGESGGYILKSKGQKYNDQYYLELKYALQNVGLTPASFEEWKKSQK